MLHPSYTELMSIVNKDRPAGEEVVKSRYSIVMGTAKRARQLIDNGYMEQEDHSVKPLSIAVDELFDGSVRILNDEEAAAEAALHRMPAAALAQEAPAQDSSEEEPVSAETDSGELFGDEELIGEEEISGGEAEDAE